MASLSPILVFQGEFAVLKGDANCIIKTSIPKECVVVILHNKENQLSALGHFDEYTDIVTALMKINENFRKHHKDYSLKQFNATVMGGVSHGFSENQSKLLIETLKTHGAAVKIQPLPSDTSQRKQVTLNPKNGEFTFVSVDNKIEYTQQREYGDWNNILDEKYPGISGDKIPYFYARRAWRQESSLPSFNAEGPNFAQNCQRLEYSGRLALPLKPRRREVISTQVAVDRLSQMVSAMKSPYRELCEKSIKDKNFNLLLRQLSSSPQQFPILKFVVQNRHVLGIDIHSRGEKSGTASDLAKTKNNTKAVTLLSSKMFVT